MKEINLQDNLDFKDEWLDQAIKYLAHFNCNPFTTRFLHKHNLLKNNSHPKPNNQQEMHALIKTQIIDKTAKLQFKDLVEYMDELKMWGKQNIFLYRIKPEEKENLSSLLDDETILNLEYCYNKNIYKWESNKPFLAEVRHNNNQEEIEWITFKWIETREFDVINPMGSSFERSTNFLLINLITGNAQLRIQTLQSWPRENLDILVDKYKCIADKLIKFNKFRPLSLEPIMKQFLINPILPVVQWKVKTKKGNLIGAKIKKSLLQRILKLLFINYKVQLVRVYWTVKQVSGRHQRLFFKIKANNEVTFNAITDKLKVDFIVGNLLKEKIVSPQPEPIVDKISKKIGTEKTENIINKIIQHIPTPFFIVIIRAMFNAFTIWLKQFIISEALNISFIILELIVYILYLLYYYGERRIKRVLIFFGIPVESITNLMKFIIGNKIIDIANINKKYNEWMDNKNDFDPS